MNCNVLTFRMVITLCSLTRVFKSEAEIEIEKILYLRSRRRLHEYAIVVMLVSRLLKVEKLLLIDEHVL